MKKILFLIGVLAASPAWADSTIEGLTAGAAVSATDLYPTVQPTSPATKVTAAQVKTFTSASPALTGTATAPDASVWNSTNLSLAPAGTITNPTLAFTTCGTNCGILAPASAQLEFVVGGANKLDYGISHAGQWQFNAQVNIFGVLSIGSGQIFMNNGPISNVSILGFNSGGNLSSPTTNAIQFGVADSATPAAQLVKFQNGTGTNISGQNATVTGSLSTGTGTDGDIIFQTGVKNGGSNATPATATTAVTIKGETQETIFNAPIRTKGYTVSALPAGNQGDRAFVTDATACTFLGALTGGSTVFCPVVFNGTAWVGG